MSRTYDGYVTHPVIGTVFVEYWIESPGEPNDYFYGGGSGPEWGVNRVITDLYPHEIVWYFPNKDYSSVESLLEDTVNTICSEWGYEDPDW